MIEHVQKHSLRTSLKDREEQDEQLDGTGVSGTGRYQRQLSCRSRVNFVDASGHAQVLALVKKVN
ncbi:hypothetical protein [Paracoccus marcusii]|uniref:hypothetical protein n=1 Tax=Paracoccus marcusii TaxID=59779 RepID=UPI0035A742C3